LQDFAVFSSIEPTEYIDNLFKLNSVYGCPRLIEFETIVNREMWWVVTEICREKSSSLKRARLIKKFIKIARQCRDFKNFNSMFAIMSGLEKPAVRRLHHSWEKVAGKYMRWFDELQRLLDPSRNMSIYRQHLHELAAPDPPVIPLFPVIKKDLTFLHVGNETYTDGLINYEKLRMIAKEIREVTRLASAPYVSGGARTCAHT
jgi:Rap guanine nucleotide exchange factor 2